MGAVTNDSNSTGLAYAEEVLGTPGVLPGSPIWYPLEPNNYSDFGSTTTSEARAPISPSRQRRKGSVVDRDSVAGFNHDWVSRSLFDVMQGFMFADWRKKTDLLVTAATGSSYTVASGGAAFTTKTLLFAEGFNTPANNGMKPVTASTATSVSVAGLVAEASPPAAAHIQRVGVRGAAAEFALAVSGSRQRLTSSSLDLTTLGLLPGQWVFIGGDGAAFQFATAGANGFYRVAVGGIAAGYLEFDRIPGTATITDTGTGKTVDLYFGHFIKNESDPLLQKLRTYQLERRVKTTELEYIKGAGANTLALVGGLTTLLKADLGFIGLDSESATSAKAGTRVVTPAQTSYSTSGDVARLRLQNDNTGLALAAYATEVRLSIDNGIEPVKAIGAIGGIDLTTKDFMVSGASEWYFTTFAAVDAIKANADVGLDFAMTANVGGLATGWLFDIPLVQLGDGKAKIEKDRPVKLPISYDAVAHPGFDHTLSATYFAYLPQLSL